jgi:hypothetical protein
MRREEGGKGLQPLVGGEMRILYRFNSQISGKIEQLPAIN